MTTTLKVKPGNSPIEFLGQCDKIVSYNDIVPYTLNDEYRGFSNIDSEEEYNNLLNNIQQNGLMRPIEVWYIKSTDEYVIMGGHTRRKILYTLYCTEFPISVVGEADDISCDKLYQAWAADNVRQNPTDIAKFFSIEKRIKSKEDNLGRHLEKSEIETICNEIGLNPGPKGKYTKIHNLMYGYKLKGVQVQPFPRAIDDLKEGKKEATVGALHAVQLKYHREMHNPQEREYDQDVALEQHMEMIEIDMVEGLKDYALAISELDVPLFKGIYLTEVCDKQHYSGLIHYMAAAYFVECFNNCNPDSKFTARVSTTSEKYDIYIEDLQGTIVNTVEVKNTDKKNPNWSSDNAKGGYHLLVNYSQELNFYVGLMYIDKNVWTEFKGKWSLKLNDACLASKNTFIHEIAGQTMLDDGVYQVQKQVIKT